MSVSYTCPECKAVLRTANPVPVGKQVKCPKCQAAFVPVPQAFALAAEEPPPRPKAPAPGVLKPTAPPAPSGRPAIEDDDVNPYGVARESDEEIAKAEKNKPRFGSVRDKFKKSARGPASALLVMPSNILIFVGALTCLAGIGIVIVGLWPLVFTDAPPGDEEIMEQAFIMILGVVAFGWGALVCVGSSKMQGLESYSWAMAGAILGVPLLGAGIYALAMLRNPKVIAGFQEVEGAIDDEKKEGEDKDEDDD